MPGKFTYLKHYDGIGKDQESELSVIALKSAFCVWVFLCTKAALEGGFYENFYYETVATLPISHSFNKSAELFSMSSVNIQFLFSS